MAIRPIKGQLSEAFMFIIKGLKQLYIQHNGCTRYTGSDRRSFTAELITFPYERKRGSGRLRKGPCFVYLMFTFRQSLTEEPLIEKKRLADH